MYLVKENGFKFMIKLLCTSAVETNPLTAVKFPLKLEEKLALRVYNFFDLFSSRSSEG